jgi:type IV secretory pathway VirB4 component
MLDSLFGPSNKNPKDPNAQANEEALRVYKEGVTTLKDIISPSAMEINFNYIQLGSYFVRSFFVFTYPRYLYTEWLSPIINADFEIDTSIFVYPMDTKEIMQKLRTKVTQLESNYSEQQEKGMVRDPVLETAYQDVEELRDTLQQGQSRFFKMSLYFALYAKSLEELESLTNLLESTLGGQLIFTKRAVLQQEDCFNSCLPMGDDKMIITRNFDTGALSTSFPFVSSDLSNNEGILYGINRHNNSLVLFDRFTLENANMVVLAKSGSGKSYAIKLEALRSMMLGSDIIVIDPENEYETLCDAVGGTYLNVSLNSNYRINPFDLSQIALEHQDEGEDILRSNVIMLHGLVKIMLGGVLTALEDNILDRAIIEAYASKGITSDPTTQGLAPPLMGDLEKVLSSINGGEDMAERLKKYTSGTFSGLLNQPSNISLDNRFIVFCIRDLEEELRPIAMYIILNYIWSRVKSERKKRTLIVEEAWIMMKYEESAQFIYSMAKRARKYYLGLTTISQDVDEFISSPYGRAIINNTSLSFLMKQHPANVDIIASVFNMTQAEKYFLLNCEVGEGLFFAGLNHVALKVVASYEEDQLITTNPEQLNAMEAETQATDVEPAT